MDLLLPFDANLPIHIENMSLVTATQARNPFERHVKFNSGVVSLGPQSTTTSPGHTHDPQTAPNLSATNTPQPLHDNPTHGPLASLPNAVTAAAGAPTLRSHMSTDDSCAPTPPININLSSTHTSSTPIWI